MNSHKLDFDKRLYFLTFCIFIVALGLLQQWLLLTDNLYYTLYGEQLAAERIAEIISFQKEWGWVGYLLVPVIYSIKFTLVAGTVGVGLLLAGVRFSFRRLFHAAMLAEAVFLIPAVLKLLWFLFVRTDYDFQDLQYFYPFSLLALFDVRSLNPLLLYPLQLFNVFEVLYVLALAWLLRSELNTVFKQRLAMVVRSYLPGLVLWVVLVLFVQVSLMP